MKGMEIKQNMLNLPDLKQVVHSKACISKKKQPYPISILVLNVLVNFCSEKEMLEFFLNKSGCHWQQTLTS